MLATILTALVALTATVTAHPHRHDIFHQRFARDTPINAHGVSPTANSTIASNVTVTAAPAVVTVYVQPLPANISTNATSYTNTSTTVLSGTTTITTIKFVFVTPGPQPQKRDVTTKIVFGVPWYVTVSATATTFSAVTTSSSSTSSSSTATATATANVQIATTGSKKGLAYNDASLTNVFAGQSIGWTYDWASSPLGTPLSTAEYVPMLWGTPDFGTWDSALKKAIAGGSTHALSFNEPDHSAQANMQPSVAAAAHIQYMNPYSSQVAIGSPAITNGGGSMGVAWLSNFFSACNGQCKVDFVTFHWYDSASNFAYFTQHVQDVIALAQKNGVNKVWLTEFGASGSDAQVAAFMAQALPYLDNCPQVERYAYFMCSNGVLINGKSLSTIGQAYVTY